jgi:hypothetical protein
MKHRRLGEVGRRGWFIGDYPEAVIPSKHVEICYVEEGPGPVPPHYHRVCSEIVVIVSGHVQYQGKVYSDRDILILEPGEVNDMIMLDRCQIIGVKMPAGGDDKVYV